MELLANISLENKYLRHGLFWLAWVTGFTFIKSFGYGLEAYAGWLAYYILTLPVFLAHTYLVVYWAAKNFLSGPKTVLFVVLFLLLMFFFSFIEMFLTKSLLLPLFPSVFTGDLDYTDPLNLLISGIGNLYIILVFAAAKMVRSWYLANKKGQQLMKERLFMERADANAGIQPGMLLFSVRYIEKISRQRPEEVAEAIAMLSGLLSAVMQAHKSMMLRLDEEIKNVRNLLKLYALLMKKELPVLKIEQCNTSIIALPAFIVFSPLEIVIRHFNWMPHDHLEVCIRGENMVSLSWNKAKHEVRKPKPAEIMEELDTIYPGRYQVRIEDRSPDFTIWISEDPAWKAESHSQSFQGNIATG